MSQIAAEAAFEGRDEMDAVKHSYEDNRRILVGGLPRAGLETFLPVDGAFYLYANIGKFSDDSHAFAQAMLNEAHVAATPGIDFDPIDGRYYLRFCYAGSQEETIEAVLRFGIGFQVNRTNEHRNPIDIDIRLSSQNQIAATG